MKTEPGFVITVFLRGGVLHKARQQVDGVLLRPLCGRGESSLRSAAGVWDQIKATPRDLKILPPCKRCAKKAPFEEKV